MASDVSGMTSYKSKGRESVKLQAGVTLQEEVTRLAQKRLAMKVLGAEIQSTSNRSVRSCDDMRSPDVLSPPSKYIKLVTEVEDHPLTVLMETMTIKKQTRVHLPSINLVHPHLPQHQ